MNTTNEALIEQIKNVPPKPGVYKYFDNKNKIIYVGKAKNLKNRVRSYFYTKLDRDTKTARLVKSINSLEYIETLSEFEALLLEAELIREYQPKYNIALKDDKSYIYIVIRRQKEKVDGKKVTLPMILPARQQDLQKTDVVFGPYPGGYTARSVIRTIRRIFPYRDCSTSKFNRYHKLGQPCLYGHIGLCQAPCTNNVTPEEYRRDIKRIEKLLSGESVQVIKSLEKEMKVQSKAQNYEEAAKYRDMLKQFEYVRQDFKSAHGYIDNPYLVNDLREKAMKELKKNLQMLSDLPRRIECYDMSNVSGTDSVGSMVVAIDGDTVNSEYKRFKIKGKTGPDDFANMEEVLTRRLKRDWDEPDLLVVDGGKGQVTAGMKALTKVNRDIPLIGIAKRNETLVYLNEEGEFVEINLERDNLGLQLIQRLRDEAHRFAQSYHHKLRLKRIK